ncbi:MULTISPECIES: hypothetical protein [Methylobacterium]|uniref:Uncharacterized protein n=1 Tax=Methylobacterium bullatum TaxID=570505 RepID=A0A679JUK5_9HYPH|nr:MULTISPECIES: hypothetical protein [Methylobacterium]KQO43632.1 hypothetical protein ASF08_09800 [Methylobacterium sp. Leaf85]MBD8904702.1 hypothetical protein [Methylobacterium bullatum]TXN23770.1 hypothetical protein FV220_20800 [Methylobacterium sp. WL19]CAA2144192.1 hypothetical protein MBLL_03310 [Methylobacterium bullatum]GJD37768.1 hypothetical protein OICFNHDK_0206 [Methylobacterium bullatum]
MIDRGYLIAAAFAFGFVLSAPAWAQNAPKGYYEAMAEAGGQLDAFGVACGKIDRITATTHRSKLQQDFATKGLSAVEFARIYDKAFDAMTVETQSNPASLKASCDKISKIVTPPK